MLVQDGEVETTLHKGDAVSMKTILLLGGYGFLGTNILCHIDRFCRDRYNVVVFDKFQMHPAGLQFSCITDVFSGDFSDEACIRSIFKSRQIDLVIHSLSTTIPISAFNARYDIESNLIPTVSLLNLMVEYGVHDIVYLSSGGAVYGKECDRKHSETDAVFPISSYGVVKLAIEKYLVQYKSLYGLTPLILRLSNPYGPYHYSMRQGICNVAIEHAFMNTPLTVWGDGNAKKDYIYVEDFVRILFLLLENQKSHSSHCVFNVASGQVLSVNSILQLIHSFAPSFSWRYEDASVLDVSRFELDTSLLSSVIGPYPFTPIEEGLKRTIEWTQDKYSR